MHYPSPWALCLRIIRRGAIRTMLAGWQEGTGRESCGTHREISKWNSEKKAGFCAYTMRLLGNNGDTCGSCIRTGDAATDARMFS